MKNDFEKAGFKVYLGIIASVLFVQGINKWLPQLPAEVSVFIAVLLFIVIGALE